jgi:putative nucleotidyltransferase with HDIG domain
MSLESAQSLLQGNVELPTLPQVVAKINALVDDPDVGVREIGAAVGEDAPIAAKVLKIANSAYFGLREKVVSTEHATAVLGVRMLRTVAMQASVIKQYEHLRGQEHFSFDGLWRHSILTGQVCAALAGRCRARIRLAPEEFQVVGLLHDMGKILLLEGKPKEYFAALQEARATSQPEFAVEVRTFGFHHGHVGALIARQWGLPALVSDAIEYHHGPREALASNGTVALVALVNLALHEVEAGRTNEAVSIFDASACKLLGLAADDVAGVLQQAEIWRQQIQI